MKKLLFINIFLLATSILFASRIDERVKTFDVSVNGVVTARLTTGNITVSAWDRNQVEIKVRGIRDRDLEQYTIRQSGSNIDLKYNGGWGNNLSFVITVPVQFNLDLKTMNGDLKVRSTIEGYVRLNTSGGDLEVTNVNGETNLNSSGGDIRTGNIEGEATISTMGGDLRCGSFFGREANLTTMGGEIRIQNVQNILSAVTYGGDIKVQVVDGTAELKTYGGDIQVDECSGNIKLETFGGDLTLNKSSGFVQANTSGGDIKLRRLTFATEAITAGGDVTVELDPAPNTESYLESSGGDVRLIIPSSANTEINAVIDVSGSWHRNSDDYEIKSYIEPIKIEKNKSSKEIIGHYILNNPKSIINLKTSNGDIKIRKSK